MTISAKTWRKAIIYWELYHKKNSEIQGIHVHCVYIIHFVHFIQFFYQVKNMFLCFSTPFPDIKRSIIYYAFGVPATPLNFREGWKTYMQQIRRIIPRIGVILTA